MYTLTGEKDTTEALPRLKTLVFELLKLGLPSIAEMVFVQTMSMIDMMMVGTVGSVAIASVGITNQPFFVLLVPFSAMNAVVGAIVARRRGEGDREGAQNTLRHVLVIAVLLAVVLSAFGSFFTKELLLLVGTTDDIMPLAIDYLRIIVLGLPLQALGLAISAVQRGLGNTRIVMYTNIAGNIVNVVFNYLLIGGKFGFPALGVKGAAIGTVLGQLVIVIIAVFAISRENSYARLEFKTKFRFDKDILINITRMASSASVDLIAVRIGNILFVRSIIQLGTPEFTFYQIVGKITPLLYAVFDGLCAALLSFVGKSLGEKKPDLTEKYISAARIIAVGLSVIMCILLILFGDSVLMMFTADVSIMQFATVGIAFFVVQNFVYALLAVNSYSLRGAGDVVFVALPVTLGILILRPVLGHLLIVKYGFGLAGAFITILTDLAMRVVLYTFRIKSGKWKNKKA